MHAEIEEFIKRLMNAYQLPGVAVGIMAADKVIYCKGFGVHSIGHKATVSGNTVFQMGSLSKVFVATAIMQLAEQGRIDIDEKLVTYLPYFRMKDERYGEITTRHILSHTSGIPDVEDFEWSRPQNDEGAARRYVESFVGLPLMGTPGEFYHYSNRAYDALADLIHVVSGKLFETYMKEHLFQPMSMRDSTFIYPEIKRKLLAWPHQLNKNFRNGIREIYPYNRIHAPSSTLYSSTADMMNWISTNLSNGAFKNTLVVRRESHALLMDPVVTTEQDTYMCLAWKKCIRRGHTFFVSLGGEPGFRSFLILLPDQKLGVIASSNSDTISAEHIGLPIMFRLLGEQLPVPRTPIYFPMARVLVEKGIGHAIDEYRHLKSQYSDQYDFHGSHLNELAYKLLHKRHKTKEAATVFELIISDNEAYWWTYSGLAQAYERLGKIESAIKNYRIAVELNPGNQHLIQRLQNLEYINSNHASLQVQ